MKIEAIINCIDQHLIETITQSIGAVEANKLLEKKGILKDSKSRRGYPLRKLLREKQIPHAYKDGSRWKIPLSPSKETATNRTISQDRNNTKSIEKENSTNSTETIKRRQEARLKYKPNKVKYLLIAEAPPKENDRFFYYENVPKHDHLFLAIAAALYPQQKKEYLCKKRDSRIKESILQNLKADGFYLLDLSKQPKSSSRDKKLSQHLPSLKERIEEVANKETYIILIKTSIYDIAFPFLQKTGLKNVVDIRIPFPSSGHQKRFNQKFCDALQRIGLK